MATLLGNPIASTDDAIRRRNESATGYLPEDEDTLKKLNFLKKSQNGQWTIDSNLISKKEDISTFLNWYSGERSPPFPPVVRRILCFNRAKLQDIMQNVGTSSNLRTGTKQKLVEIEELLKKDDNRPIPNNAKQCAAMGKPFLPTGSPGVELEPPKTCGDGVQQTASQTVQSSSNSSSNKQAGCQTIVNCGDTAALGLAIGELKSKLDELIAKLSADAQAKMMPVSNAVGQLENAVASNAPNANTVFNEIETKYSNINIIQAALTEARAVLNTATINHLRNVLVEHFTTNKIEDPQIIEKLDNLIKLVKTNNAVETTNNNLNNLNNLNNAKNLNSEKLLEALTGAISPLLEMIKSFGLSITAIQSNIETMRTNVSGMSENMSNVKSTLTVQAAELASIREMLSEIKAIQQTEMASLKSYLLTKLEFLEQQMDDLKELASIKPCDTEELTVIIKDSLGVLLDQIKQLKHKNNVVNDPTAPPNRGPATNNVANDPVVDQASAEIQELQGRLEALSAKQKNQNSTITAKELQISELVSQLEALKSPQSPNKARIADLEASVQRNSAKRAELEAQIEALQAEIAQLKESHEEERSQAQSTLQALGDEKDALQRMLDACNEAKTQLETAISQKSDEIQTITAKIAELEALPPQENPELESLRQILEEKTRQLLTLQEQNKDLSENHALLTAKLAECEASKQTLEAAVSRCQANLNSKQSKFKAELDGARKKAASNLEARQKEYTLQLKKLEEEHGNLVRELSEGFDSELNVEVEKQVNKCKEIEKRYTETLAAKDAKIHELEELLQKGSNSVTVIQQLKDSVASKDAEIQELTAQLQARPENCDELTAAIASKDAEIQELTTQLQARPENCDELTATIASKEAEIQELTAQLQARPENCDELTATIASKDAEIQELTTQLQARPENCDDLKAVISELTMSNTEKDAIIEELRAFQSKYEQIEPLLAEKDAKIAELESKLTALPAESEDESPPPPPAPATITSRLVELPSFLSNFKDIQIKIKPDLANGLRRMYRTSHEKNTHQVGSNTAIDPVVRDKVYELLAIMGPSSKSIDHVRLEEIITDLKKEPQFDEFFENEAYGLNASTPIHSELVSYRLLKYIVDESQKLLGGSPIKISKRQTRRRR